MGEGGLLNHCQDLVTPERGPRNLPSLLPKVVRSPALCCCGYCPVRMSWPLLAPDTRADTQRPALVNFTVADADFCPVQRVSLRWDRGWDSFLCYALPSTRCSVQNGGMTPSITAPPIHPQRASPGYKPTTCEDTLFEQAPEPDLPFNFLISTTNN